MPENDMAETFNQVSNPSMWQEVALIVGGFAVSKGLTRAGDSLLGTDLPNEVYGIAVTAGSVYMGQRKMAYGAGTYVIIELLRRAGLFQLLEVRD